MRRRMIDTCSAGLAAAVGAVIIAAPVQRLHAQEIRHEHVWRSDDHHRRLNVRMRGDVELTPDERAIARLSPGGRLQIEHAVSGAADRTLIVTSRPNGQLEYAYLIDGRTRPWDAEGQAWLAALLPEVAREWGVGATERVRRLRSAHGTMAVLAMIDSIRSSSSRRTHLDALLAMGPLSSGESARALGVIGGIPSSSERSRLLRTMANDLDFAHSAVRTAFFAATEGIPSSSEKRRVLGEVLARPELGEQATREALLASRTIASSSERAAVLVAAAERRPLTSEPLRQAFFQSVDGISSSSERRRVLVALLRVQGSDRAVVRDVVRSAAGIPSDSEKTAVLMEIPVAQLRDDATARVYRDTLDTIRSSSARERVLRRLLEATG